MNKAIIATMLTFFSIHSLAEPSPIPTPPPAHVNHTGGRPVAEPPPFNAPLSTKSFAERQALALKITENRLENTNSELRCIKAAKMDKELKSCFEEAHSKMEQMRQEYPGPHHKKPNTTN